MVSVYFGQFRVTVARAVHGNIFLPGVLMLPMLANSICDLDQPSAVFGQFQHVRHRKILGGILRRIAERLEQPSGSQRRDVVRLAVQHPARLLRREAGGQLTEQRQEAVLIFFHATAVALLAESEQVKSQMFCMA